MTSTKGITGTLCGMCRALQFDKAQQTAMKLHRMKGHDYLWWIVTCLLLQARQAGAPMGPCLTTTLAMSSQTILFPIPTCRPEHL